MLQRGGIPVDAFTTHVTKDIVQVLQGTIILFVSGGGFLPRAICPVGFVGALERFKSPKLSSEDNEWLKSSTQRLSGRPCGCPPIDPGGARRSVFRTRGRHQYCPRGHDAGRSFHGRSGNAMPSAVLTWDCSLACWRACSSPRIHALACIRYQADQVVTGTAINILMLGMPAFLSGAFFPVVGFHAADSQRAL